MKHQIKKLLKPFKEKIESFFKVRIVRVRKQIVPDIPHSRIIPGATYSPWLGDSYFCEVYNIAKDYSLVDQSRMYELYKLVCQVSTLKGDLLEVGTWRGGTSAIIQSALRKSNSISKLFVADTFNGVVKAGSNKDTLYKGGEHSDASINDIEELFFKLKIPTPEVLIGIFPDDHKDLNIEKLSFVHSDVDAYNSTKGVIEWSIPRLLKGGLIVFDDYGFLGCEGVTRYVNELMSDLRMKKEFLLVYNLNGHAILIKK